MAESLNDRHFESYRRVQPGRIVKNRLGEGAHHEEYAQAIVDMDGEPVTLTIEQLLEEIVLQLRRTNLMLESLTMEVTIADVA